MIAENFRGRRGSAGGDEAPEGGGKFRVAWNRVQVLEVYQARARVDTDIVLEIGKVYSVERGGDVESSSGGTVAWRTRGHRVSATQQILSRQPLDGVCKQKKGPEIIYGRRRDLPE